MRATAPPAPILEEVEEVEAVVVVAVVEAAVDMAVALAMAPLEAVTRRPATPAEA